MYIYTYKCSQVTLPKANAFGNALCESNTEARYRVQYDMGPICISLCINSWNETGLPASTFLLHFLYVYYDKAPVKQKV